MIDEPKNTFTEITSDPNFLMILAGAAIWYIGYYIWFIGPLLTTSGFALVCFASALTALKRPVTTAWPGMLLGGLIMIIGDYLDWIFVIGPIIYIAGAIMVIFFAIPLALQRGELPVLTELQRFWDKQSVERRKKSKKEAKAAESNKPEETEDSPSDNYQ